MSEATPGAARAWHTVPWGVALIVWLGLARPLLLVSALDVETLIVNLYEQQAAPTWLIPWTSALIQWAPVPLLLVVVAGGVYGLLRPFVKGLANPGRNLSRGRRVVLAALVLLPYLLFTVPGAVAAATLIAVEALSWVEWLYDLNPTMESLYVIVPACLLPGARIGGLLALRAALGFPRGKPGPGVLRLMGRLLVGATLWVTLSAAGAVAVAAGPQAARASQAHGATTFKENCGTCHFRTASLNFVKSDDEWAHTVKTMQGFDPSIDAREADDAIAFLTTVRSQSDGWLFRTRCSRCHGSTHANWEHRSREDWEGMIERIARWSPVFYDATTNQRLLDWLVEHRGDESAEMGVGRERWDRYMEVERQCAPCHSISWNADDYREGDFAKARATVARMSQKMVEPLSDEEIDQIARDWKALLDDQHEFDRLFPHDQPEPAPKPSFEVEDRRPERGGNY